MASIVVTRSVINQTKRITSSIIAGRVTASQAAFFATATKPNTGTVVGYYNEKQAAKERRRALYEARQERDKRVASRRVGKPRDEKRQEFRKWFIKKKVNDEYMERKARQANLGWKYQVAVVLERINVVLPDIEQWEADFLELEAHMAQFGKQYPKEFLQAADESAKIATTPEELLELLPKGYTPAPRETEADLSGNVQTTNRKLKTSIYLALQEDGKWQMPTVELAEDETLVDAAKRALETKVGSQVEFWCPSNAPFAIDLKAQQDGQVYGTKTFFVKVQYDEGDVSKTTLAADDFAWLDRTEFADRVREDQGDTVAQLYRYML
jgi:ADP-ribose pyrophosphatase YjhB (NUDIX family)